MYNFNVQEKNAERTKTVELDELDRQGMGPYSSWSNPLPEPRYLMISMEIFFLSSLEAMFVIINAR